MRMSPILILVTVAVMACQTDAFLSKLNPLDSLREHVMKPLMKQCKLADAQGAKTMVIKTIVDTGVCLANQMKLDELISAVTSVVIYGDIGALFDMGCQQLRGALDKCIKPALSKLRPCLHIPLVTVDIPNQVFKFMDTLLNFMCGNNGEEMALLGSDGVRRCIQSNNTCHTVNQCLYRSGIQNTFASNPDDSVVNALSVLAGNKSCETIEKLGACGLEGFATCDDPAAGNLAGGLVKSAKQALACPLVATSSSGGVFSPSVLSVYTASVLVCSLAVRIFV